MSREIVVTGRIREGVLKISRRATFDAEISKLPDSDVLLILKLGKGRSLRANAFYWGVVVNSLADAYGWNKDAAHEFLKAKFNSELVTITDENGEILDEVKVAKSTARMRVPEFSDYVERCCAYLAAEHGIELPTEQAWAESPEEEQCQQNTLHTLR